MPHQKSPIDPEPESRTRGELADLERLRQATSPVKEYQERQRRERRERERSESILERRRERQRQAEGIAAREGISITEALKVAGAPIPEYRVEQAKAQRLKGTIEVGTKTGKPQRIVLTPEVKALKVDRPELYKKLVEQGIKATQVEIGTQRELAKQSQKAFEKANVQLKSGEWVDKVELARVKEESPEYYRIITIEGLEAANKYSQEQLKEGQKATLRRSVIETSLLPYKSGKDRYDLTGYLKKNPGKEDTLREVGFNVSDIKQASEQASLSIPQAIWRSFTPWKEEAGETLLTHLSVKRKGKTQEELKADYEAFIKQPLWAKLLTQGVNIYKDNKGVYHEYLAGDPPLITPATKSTQVIKAAQKALRTISPQELGMSEVQFSRFLKARRELEGLTPEAFKLREQTSFAVKALEASKQDQLPISTWQRVLDSLKKGEEISKISRKTTYAGPQEVIRKLAGMKQSEMAKELSKYTPEEISTVLSEMRKQGLLTKPILDNLNQVMKEKHSGIINQAVKEAAKKRMATTVEARRAIPGRLTYARMEELIKDWQAMKPGMAVKTMIAGGLVLPVIVSNPQAATEILSRTDIKTQQRALKQVTREIESLASTKTITKTDLKNLEEVKNKVALALATKTVTQTSTKLETKTATALELKNQVAELTDTKTATALELQVKQLARTIAKQSTPTRLKTPTLRPVKIPLPVIPSPGRIPLKPKPKPKPKPVPLPGASDEQKRKFIRESARGKVTWNMGKLHGKDVWHVRFDTGQHIVVLGKVPQGAKILADGPGSASKTAQRVGDRRGFDSFTQEHGAVKASLSPSSKPKGAVIRFRLSRTKSQRIKRNRQ